MSPEEGRDDEFEQRTRRLRFRIAFFLTSLAALSVIVTLPFSVKSVVDDILGPVTGHHGAGAPLYPRRGRHDALPSGPSLALVPP